MRCNQLWLFLHANEIALGPSVDLIEASYLSHHTKRKITSSDKYSNNILIEFSNRWHDEQKMTKKRHW